MISGPIVPTVVRRMKKSWLLGACAVTFTGKATCLKQAGQKLRNGPIPVNPKCEFEAFGELSRAVEHVFGSMTNLPAAGR